MSHKRILITNDDGIDSDGIRILAETAKQFGEVWVVAPDSQRSAMSHSLSCHAPFEVWKADFAVDGVRAFERADGRIYGQAAGRGCCLEHQFSGVPFE